MFILHLNKILLHAYHGVHEEETTVGNEFEISLSVSFNELQKINVLEDTINYVSVFEIVKVNFGKTQHLLETVAQNIVEAIHEFDKRIVSIDISIYKINAPIINFNGAIGISYSKAFS
jgi:7,8-dihydroneopterin aldolase/epimerase/oxygenase